MANPDKAKKHVKKVKEHLATMARLLAELKALRGR